MNPKYPKQQDKPYLIQKKKKHLINVIFMSLVIIPFLLGFIGTFLAEFFYPLFYELFSPFMLIGSFFTLIMTSLIGILLVMYSIKLHRARMAIKQKIYVNPPLDNSILQILIDNQGKTFTITDLLTKLSPTDGTDGLKVSLDRLVPLKKVSVDVKQLTPHYYIDLKKLGLA